MYRKCVELTEPQKRVWYTQMMYPESSMFIIGGILYSSGTVNLDYWKKAVELLIERTDSFQIRIGENEEKQPYQYFLKAEHVQCPVTDFSGENDREKKAEEWIKSKWKEKMPILKNPLYQIELFIKDKETIGILVKIHHLIADGWSFQLIKDRLCRYYEKLTVGESLDLAEEISYKEFIESEKQYLQSPAYQKDKAFWMEQFRQLPNEVPVTSEKKEARRVTSFLSGRMSEEVLRYCEKYRITAAVFFTAIHFIFLKKLTDKNDIVAGIPVLGRRSRRERNIVGMMVGILPFRYTLNPQKKVTDMMQEIKSMAGNCYKHQRFPYNHLVHELSKEQSGYNLSYRTCLNYYNTKMEHSTSGEYVHCEEIFNGEQEYALQIIIRNWEDRKGFQVDIDYLTDEYGKEELDAYKNGFLNLIQEVISNSECMVSNLSLLKQEEKNEIVFKYNDTRFPIEKETLLDLFEEAVQKNPQKIAIQYGEEKLTYAELDKKSFTLAGVLKEQFSGDEQIVALYMEHSIETVVCIMGILKARAAYLPIDTDTPKERFLYILQDADIQICLTNTEIPVEIKQKVNVISSNEINWDDVPCLDSLPHIQKNNLAYIIYTSGSTGMPKGVMIEHGQLMNYISWAVQAYSVCCDDVFPLYSSLAFDLTVTSIFSPLAAGAQIMVYRSTEQEYALNQILRENRCTIIKLTPSHLLLMNEFKLGESKLSRLIVGGENLKAETATKVYENFKRDVAIFNEYGPTEATVGCMIYRFSYESDKKGVVPIGKPAANTQIYLLDKDRNPVTIGQLGEMYISGDGVARGYLNRPELNEEKFVHNPFIKGARMYRTGDLARFISKDNMECIGRIDHQVKIRGHRVELGEIENEVMEYEGITDAVAVISETDIATQRLGVYYVAEKVIQKEELWSYLKNMLPDYMIPSVFMKIDEMPLTVNGKVDKKRLPPFKMDNKESNFKKPETENEIILWKAAGQLFGLEHINMNENFFLLGGDSIKAIQLISRIDALGYQISMRNIFNNPVLYEMALFLEKKQKNVNRNALCKGEIISTPIVKWFLQQNLRYPEHYNQSVMLTLKFVPGADKLSEILARLVRQHDMLRSSYMREKAQLMYKSQYVDIAVEKINLSGFTDEDKKKQINQNNLRLQQSMKTNDNLMLKSCFYQMDDGKGIWFITMHHLITDGVSWRILLEDIDVLLKQEEDTAQLPGKTASYQEWAQMLEQYKIDDMENEYWNEMEKGQFAFYKKKKEICDNSKTNHEFISGKKQTEELLGKANEKFHTKPNELIMTALLLTLEGKFHESDIGIYSEGHGREHSIADVSRTVGWFTVIYPMHFCLPDDSVSEKIKYVKERIRSVPLSGIGYGKRMWKPDSIALQKQSIRFNYLGEFQTEYSNFTISGLERDQDVSEENGMSCMMDINCIVYDGRLRIQMQSEEAYISTDELKEFQKQFSNAIEEVLECCNSGSIDYTPSDFNTIDISQTELNKLFQ